MEFRPFQIIATVVVGLGLAGAERARGEAAPIRFNRDIRPILSENCFACHGPDSTHRKASLRLDVKAGMFDARKGGRAVVPGKPGESLIYRHITSADPDEVMPPVKSGKTLTAAQKDLLKRWIEEGAAWQAHWSFIAPVRPTVPAVKDKGWVRNPIDAFVLSRLEAEKLSPAPEADRAALIRRVSLDLIGLPPTPREVTEFVEDQSPDAYEKVVERLLASPRYGEHRARYWLDAARYADTHGIHNDNYVELWPYRDWVIGAFNRNEPFDRFTIEQIAGDLIPDHTLDQQIATGFHRCNATTSEGGSIDDEVLAMYAKDRAETTGQVWMGLTVGCAVCHDHKFDPITQKEFYELTAFFRNTPQKAMDGNVKDTPPVIAVPSRADRPAWEGTRRALAEARSQRDELRRDAAPAFEAWLAGGGPAALKEPVDATERRLWVPLDGSGCDAARIVAAGDAERAEPISLGLSWGKGPSDEAALQFTAETWLSLGGAADIDADRPFSLGAWVMPPKADGSYVLASKFDGKTGKGAGWVLEIENRVPSFRLVSAQRGQAVVVKARAAARLAAGKWSHVFVTSDGSRRPDGFAMFVNGKAVGTDPPATEEPLKGGTTSAAPLRIGSDGKRDLRGGALHDFRFYARTLAGEEVEVLSKWAGVAKAVADRKFTVDQREALLAAYLNRFDEGYGKLTGEMDTLRAREVSIRRRSPVTLVMTENPRTPPKARVLFRGQYDQPRDEVTADTPAWLPPIPKDAPHNRMGLARWLVDPANPLTSRVVVNRMWQEIFGQGIVRTAGDFGIMGESPSHPELLDWLAVEFREGGWDVKRTIRLIVTSATYRQSALTTPQKLAVDPEDRLLSRGPRFRMDAEVLRDTALAAGGLLSPRIGGASVKPYQPPGVWEAVAMFGSNTRFYKQDAGESLYRRSLYTFWKRSAPPSSLDIFNAPNRIECTVRRERTDTPLQALVAMNDPQWVEAARHLAELVLKDGSDDFDSRLDRVTIRVLARKLDSVERDVCRNSFDAFAKTYAGNPAAARALIHTGESKPDETIDPAALASWTMLASQILNTDEALNK